jgi:hypothetical protein
MDSSIAAEEFPGLYRTILDGIAELERLGRRTEADRIRKAATAVYSGPWGAAGHRQLELQRQRIERVLAAPDRHAAERSPAGRLADRTAVGSLVRRLRPVR